MICNLAELSYPAGKKEQLSIYLNLFEHDLLLLSAVLMGMFNFLIDISIFLICWYSNKMFVFLKIEILALRID